MKKELDDALCAKYPKIFVNRNKNMQETCMCWGFEIGDGWYNVIDTLCHALSYSYTTGFVIGEERFLPAAPQVIADQVKEKFGGLRFYYHLEFDAIVKDAIERFPNDPKVNELIRGYSDFFNGVVHFAEVLADKTCEVTGKPGIKHYTPGKWVRTLNEEYAKTDPEMVARQYKPTK